eukprot:10808278-Heterocapsa_arctica.AAC.1
MLGHLPLFVRPPPGLEDDRHLLNEVKVLEARATQQIYEAVWVLEAETIAVGLERARVAAAVVTADIIADAAILEFEAAVSVALAAGLREEF